MKLVKKVPLNVCPVLNDVDTFVFKPQIDIFIQTLIPEAGFSLGRHKTSFYTLHITGKSTVIQLVIRFMTEIWNGPTSHGDKISCSVVSESMGAVEKMAVNRNILRVHSSNRV